MGEQLYMLMYLNDLSKVYNFTWAFYNARMADENDRLLTFYQKIEFFIDNFLVSDLYPLVFDYFSLGHFNTRVNIILELKSVKF